MNKPTKLRLTIMTWIGDDATIYSHHIPVDNLMDSVTLADKIMEYNDFLESIELIKPESFILYVTEMLEDGEWKPLGS
jgi:hypothetical protein